MTDDKPDILTRLKQHHIYRVVVIYAVVSWVLVQLANNVFPSFNLPNGDVRLLILALLLGFPVTLVLAWMLIKPADEIKLGRWQRLRWKVGFALSAAVVVLVVISGWSIWHYSDWNLELGTAGASTASAFDPPGDSLVVLPFANLSDDPKQQYFSDGITEELTDALGHNRALRVISWDTASTFRNSGQTATGFGKTLNVANVLHGSILHQGDRVRVTAELVDTVNGYQLWSAHYDDTAKNIFAVQDRITQAIADALEVKFAATQAVPTPNPQAHDLYLKGLANLRLGTAARLQDAKRDFEQALEIDPNYADAHSGLAFAYLNLTDVSTWPLDEALAKSRSEAQRALALDPHNVNALVALGSADAASNRISEAETHYQQALKLDPSSAVAHLGYGNLLPVGPSLAQTRDAVRLDPENTTAQNNLAQAYLDLGEYQQSLAPALAMARLSPHEMDSAFYLAFAYQHLHQDRNMVSTFDLIKPSTPLDRRMVNAGRLTYHSLLQRELRAPALTALNTLRHSELSPGMQAMLIQLYLALGEKATVMKMMPKLCGSAPVSCSDLAVNPIYRPLHDDPRFEKLAKRYTTVALE